ncbi:MAG: ATP-binding protein [Prevotellaceae bacterium]|nr:ATP-binding protein [Prevotellaceae bacterium]
MKMITGMRRCCKLYLLFTLFKKYLFEQWVKEDHTIGVNLENRLNKSLRNPDALLQYIHGHLSSDGQYYVMLDEVQMVSEFEDVLNSFLSISNVDVFVTGSNAKFLSKDVITEFRGRGDEIHVRPLTFKEVADFRGDYSQELIREYMLYGGLPQVILEKDVNKKINYLEQQMEHTYLRDIKERYGVRQDSDLAELVNIMASCVGGLTNPPKIADTFKSVKQSSISVDTIRLYLEYMEDAFVLERATRYDIKGRKYIDSPFKYYFEDLGLRNARLGFRQIEPTHMMENMLYNELRTVGMKVDVGQVFTEVKNVEGTRKRKTLEVDFVCNRGYERVYIQSAYAMETEEKRDQELASLRKLRDGFRRIVIVNGFQPTYMNDEGVYIVNLMDFLREPERFMEGGT